MICFQIHHIQEVHNTRTKNKTQTTSGTIKTYTRSPLEDSRLFGPSPWKILATTYKKGS